jgi:O-antigen ligase
MDRSLRCAVVVVAAERGHERCFRDTEIMSLTDRLKLLWRRLRAWMRMSPKLPAFVLGLTLYACYGGPGLLGYNGSGLVWLTALTLALLTLVKNQFRTAFPIAIWMPWIAILILGVLERHEPASVQRTIMMICPLVVGMAVASFPARPHQLAAFLHLLRLFAVILWIMFAFRSPMLVARWGVSIAPAVMASALVCAFLAVEYAHGFRGRLVAWSLMLLPPIGCVSRMASLASILTLPLTPARIALRYRVVMLAAGMALGLGFFHLPRVQQKMFFSGQGTLKDLRMDNENFRSNGRLIMREALREGIARRPVWGHGADASNAVSYVTAEQMHPHNDYLRVLYDYGYVGLAVLLLTLALQVRDLWRRVGRQPVEVQIIGYTAVASFGLFLLFMATDNIIVYPAFFGNLQFTFLGLVYGSARTRAHRVVLRPIALVSRQRPGMEHDHVQCRHSSLPESRDRPPRDPLCPAADPPGLRDRGRERWFDRLRAGNRRGYA